MLNSIIQNNLGISVIGAIVVAVALLVWNIFLQINVSRMKKNQEQLFSGKSGMDLEKVILEHGQNLKELDKDIQDLYGISNKIHDLASRSVHKVGSHSLQSVQRFGRRSKFFDRASRRAEQRSGDFRASYSRGKSGLCETGGKRKGRETSAHGRRTRSDQKSGSERGSEFAKSINIVFSRSCIMEEVEKKIVKIPSRVTVKKFAELLGLGISDVIKELMKNKILATINDEIDFETAAIIASDLGFEAEEDIEAGGQAAMTLEKLDEILKKEKDASSTEVGLRHRAAGRDDSRAC